MSLGVQSLLDAGKGLVMGPIAKATLEFCNQDGKVEKSMQCGFNPTEYSLSQSIGYRKSNGCGQDFKTDDLQVGRGEAASLSVSIFVDEKSNLESNIKEYGGKIYNAVKYRGFSSKPQNVKEICLFLQEFMHYDSKEKTTPLIGLNWGEMRFVGKLGSINIQFVMFDRDGNPTRAKVSMTIVGDDSHFLQKSFGAGKSSKTSIKSNARELAKSWGLLNPRDAT